MSVTSGRGLPVPFAFYDPESRSLRTSQVTFDSDSTPSSPTLPPSGSMRSGALYARRRSALPTSATASSSSPLLPTPRTSDTNGPGVHGDGGMDLRTTVTLLPTPAARDWKSGESNLIGTNARPLNEVAVNLLPTPRASDTGTPGRRASEGFRPPLSQVVLPLFPTPTATPYGNNQSDSPGAAVRPSLNSLAPTLLPTPAAADSRDTANFRPDGTPYGQGYGPTLLDATRHLLPTLTGAVSPPPSPAGNTPPDDEPHGQLTIAID